MWGRMAQGLWRPNRVLNRVENGVVDGMPDAYIVLEGFMNWVELKAPIEPARATTALFSGNHKLSISQRNWLLAHRQAGGRGWIAVETDGWFMLLPAAMADDVNKLTLVAMANSPIAFSFKRPAKVSDWNAMAEMLKDRRLP